MLQNGFSIRKKNFHKIPTFFQKPLDKIQIYVIILKCIIIAFSLGDFCPFFGQPLVKTHKKQVEFLSILPKTVKNASAT